MAAAPPRPPAGLSGTDVVADALRYEGLGYVYGGTGARPGDWDCSSFCSYVYGHDLGLGLPGGSWEQVTAGGTQHGPVVVTYATWGGAVTIPASAAGPGDLVLFVGQGTGGHMGIVLGPDKMISALNPSLGTLVSPIAGYGPAGAPVIYRRVTATATGPVPAQGGAAGTGWGGLLLAMIGGAAVGAGAIVVVIAAALGLAAGVAWLAGKAAREGLG